MNYFYFFKLNIDNYCFYKKIHNFIKNVLILKFIIKLGFIILNLIIIVFLKLINNSGLEPLTFSL
jgi:hypothetical protein